MVKGTHKDGEAPGKIWHSSLRSEIRTFSFWVKLGSCLLSYWVLPEVAVVPCTLLYNFYNRKKKKNRWEEDNKGEIRLGRECKLIVREITMCHNSKLTIVLSKVNWCLSWGSLHLNPLNTASSGSLFPTLSFYGLQSALAKSSFHCGFYYSGKPETWLRCFSQTNML